MDVAEQRPGNERASSAARASAWSLFVRACRLFAQRPFVSVALGTAVVVSMIAVCCGIGALSTPWFMAELLAMQLAQSLGRRLPRTKGWIAAASVLVAAVLLVAASAWLTTLAFQTQVQTDASGSGSLGTSLPQLGGLLIAAITTVIALATVIPLFYAPVILLDRGGNVGGALLESVRLVVDGGFARHLLISLLSHTVQVSPPLVAVGLGASIGGWAAAPTAVLMALPLLAVSLPIGQGMFVIAYGDVRASITNPRRTRAAGRPPRALVVAMLVCVLSPVTSLFAFGGSLVRPSRLAPGRAGNGSLIADIDLAARSSGRVFPPDTTLEIGVSRTSVKVVAGDGGGAGKLPLRSTQPIGRVRVLRSREIYEVEVTQGGRTYITRVDGAGVRRDDDLGARLSDRAPLWAITFMLGALLLALLLLGPPVYEFALVRRAYTLTGDERANTRLIHERRDRAIKHGWLACAALAPAITSSVYWAVRAVLGV